MEDLWKHFTSYCFDITEEASPYGPPIINGLSVLRKQTSISISEVSRALKISRHAYSAIENGKAIPSLLTAFKLAEYFDVSISEIFKLNPLLPPLVYPGDKVLQYKKVEDYWQKRS
jgi:putative transcriptional regulator